MSGLLGVKTGFVPPQQAISVLHAEWVGKEGRSVHACGFFVFASLCCCFCGLERQEAYVRYVRPVAPGVSVCGDSACASMSAGSFWIYLSAVDTSCGLFSSHLCFGSFSIPPGAGYSTDGRSTPVALTVCCVSCLKKRKDELSPHPTTVPNEIHIRVVVLSARPLFNSVHLNTRSKIFNDLKGRAITFLPGSTYTLLPLDTGCPYQLMG